LKVVAEVRSSVTGTHFRLPDVCALLQAPKTQYLVEAAFLVVEILSEGDTMSALLEKLREYANKGVPNIWVIDPRLQLLYSYRASALSEVHGDIIASAEIFAE
jgi:Uma2 family endonuclease